ncbi:MAG: short-chain dehydrogenase [Chitinophagaceae bacterium]
MTSDQIEKFIELQKRKDLRINIHFKERQTVSGMFIRGNDYSELKSKNLWRVVSSINVKQFKLNQDMNLTRIFNGISFTRLSEDNN